MQITVVGIDLGKNSCSIVGLDDTGAVVLRRRMRRAGVIELAAKLKPCVVAMEACCGAHHLGRAVQAQGPREDLRYRRGGDRVIEIGRAVNALIDL